MRLSAAGGGGLRVGVRLWCVGRVHSECSPSYVTEGLLFYW